MMELNTIQSSKAKASNLPSINQAPLLYLPTKASDMATESEQKAPHTMAELFLYELNVGVTGTRTETWIEKKPKTTALTSA
ncbi:hypothetical protein Tco_1124596, partial [Tanacetum coccineum]